MSATALADAAAGFGVTPGYLDTAALGVPPDSTLDALQDALGRWRSGDARAQDYDQFVTTARASFARLVGVVPEEVCVGSQVSALAGLVASSVPDGAEVVAVEGDFTSILFPFMVQADRGIRVRLVPLADVPAAIRRGTALVALSAVQSATGELADLDAVEAAAARHGAWTLIDATQACGWLPLDASRFDFVVCTAYKWLLSPRGTAFMTVRRERLDAIRPMLAGWYAGEEIWESIYGAPLRLATSARRLDVSPAWFSWIGTAASLELLERVGIEAIHAHDLALANRLRAGLGQPPGRSAIVRVEAPGSAERLNAAGIRASTRAGAARLSFHLYNTVADVDSALLALGAGG